MSTQLAHRDYNDGGMCYAACQEAFEWYNSSVFHCQKGCDFGAGRQSAPELRQEAKQMCQMYTSSNYSLMEHEDLNNVEDMRIHAVMYSNNATNLYRVCMAGVRRQKY